MRRVVALLIGIATGATAAPISVQLIDAPWSAFTTPFALNNSGQVVGVTGANDGFLYSGGSHTPVQRPNAIGGVFAWGTSPTGVSDSGTIVGTSSTPEFGISGFVFQNGIFSDLSYPGAQSTYVYGSSSHGTVVGDFWNGEWHGFLWSAGAFTTFDTPVQFPGGADFESVRYFSVNASGTILGGQEWSKDGQSYARLFLWDGAAIQYLPQLGDSVIFFPRINDNGTVVGSYYDPLGIAHGFSYGSGGTTVLDVPNALATYVTGINNSGQLTGMYYSATGDWHAFVGTEVPEPASVAIAFGGLVALALARRTRRERPLR